MFPTSTIAASTSYLVQFYIVYYKVKSTHSCRFGGGYIVSIMFKRQRDLEEGSTFIEQSSLFRGVSGKMKKRNTTLSFRVCNDQNYCTISAIFNLIQAEKRNLNILDFSIKQTTLDEVRRPHLKDLYLVAAGRNSCCSYCHCEVLEKTVGLQ